MVSAWFPSLRQASTAVICAKPSVSSSMPRTCGSVFSLSAPSLSSARSAAVRTSRLESARRHSRAGIAPAASAPSVARVCAALERTRGSSLRSASMREGTTDPPILRRASAECATVAASRLPSARIRAGARSFRLNPETSERLRGGLARILQVIPGKSLLQRGKNARGGRADAGEGIDRRPWRGPRPVPRVPRAGLERLLEIGGEPGSRGGGGRSHLAEGACCGLRDAPVSVTEQPHQGFDDLRRARRSLAQGVNDRNARVVALGRTIPDDNAEVGIPGGIASAERRVLESPEQSRYGLPRCLADASQGFRGLLADASLRVAESAHQRGHGRSRRGGPCARARAPPPGAPSPMRSRATR